MDQFQSTQQANLDLVSQLGSPDGPGFTNPAAHLFADDFVFHFFNQSLPELAGDYHGAEGFSSLFKRLRETSDTDFKSQPHSLTPYGDELLVGYVTHTASFGGTLLEIDAIVVWRVVDGLLKEAWDIPAINTVRVPEP